MFRDEKEKALVESARTGDEAAFEAIMLMYMPKALAYVRQMTYGGEDAEDIVQEAFIKAYRGLDAFKGDSSFRTWFFKVLSNTCLDHLRKKTLINKIFFFARREDEEGEEEDPLESAPDTHPGSMPDSGLMTKQLRHAIAKAVGRLPERQRAVFLLKHLEGMKLFEIAEVLGISEGAVKSHLARAVTSLREHMKGYER